MFYVSETIQSEKDGGDDLEWGGKRVRACE